MPHYKNSNNEVYWYSDEQVAGNVVASGLVPITDSEAAKLSTPTPAQLKTVFIADASAALKASDITILRCVENSVAVPSAWNVYRNALRAIINGTDVTSTALPTAPAYPKGT
jgi:hypothetical protein